MKCKNEECGKKLLKDRQFKEFCGRSCSTSYANRSKPKRTKSRSKADCKNCGDSFEYNPTSHRGLYCSNACRGKHRKTLSLEKVSNKSPCSSSLMKRWLRKHRGNECEVCKQPPKWNGKFLGLQLDHKDGNSDNTIPKNCRLVCPNCHTQTPNYGSKGAGNRYKKSAKRNKYLQRYKA